MDAQNLGPVIMVDDSEAERFAAEECYALSGLSHPWRALSSGARLLSYLAEVKAGRAPMPAHVLLDINMPEQNGLEVLQAVRAEPAFRGLSVVMFTNSEVDDDRARAAKLGASGFVRKPDSMDDYVAFFKAIDG